MLADHEILGLALGLAQAVYGESALDVDLAGEGTSLPGEPTATLAVAPAALLEDEEPAPA